MILELYKSYPFWQLSYYILAPTSNGQYVRLIHCLTGKRALLVKINGCAALISPAGEEVLPGPNEIFIVNDIDNI